MKTKLIMTAALVFAASSTAFGLTLDPAGFSGAVSLDIDNWEVSPNYGYSDAAFDYTLADDDLDNDGNIADDRKVSGVDNTWGIFELNVITDISNGDTVFTQGFKGQYLAGVFYGINDTRVRWTGTFGEVDQDGSGTRTVGDTALGVLDVEGTDLMFELYNLDSENWDETLGSSAGGPGSYPGITDQGKSPELIGTSAVNSSNISPFFNPAEYFSSVRFNLAWDGSQWVPTSANGDFRAVLDAIGGTNVTQWDHDWVANTVGPDNDITLQGNLTIPSIDWDFKSDDPVESFVTPIPEPFTMGAFGMAIAGLGGYIRRRRR